MELPSLPSPLGVWQARDSAKEAPGPDASSPELSTFGVLDAPFLSLPLRALLGRPRFPLPPTFRSLRASSLKLPAKRSLSQVSEYLEAGRRVARSGSGAGNSGGAAGALRRAGGCRGSPRTPAPAASLATRLSLSGQTTGAGDFHPRRPLRVSAYCCPLVPPTKVPRLLAADGMRLGTDALRLCPRPAFGILGPETSSETFHCMILL
ncbi:uncharacterized protein LOC134739547 [Pongo pygmaeus]|uniref:uncharacterized protein LOC134739547 n=1 Tax=Pongo pygmaeus TaxID=9600 RepID=UPI00300D3546